MCTGVELLLGALSAGSALLGKTSKPPAPKVPAAPAATARDGEAKVKVGVTDAAEDDPYAAGDEFVERRAAGIPLGNLGKSGLAL